MTEAITSDNIHLSRPKTGLLPCSAVDSTDLSDAVAGYVRDSLADNTRRAYQSDLRHFELWGGSLPASPKTVAAYLAAYADSLSVTTLIRRLASLSKAHQLHELSNLLAQSGHCATEFQCPLLGVKRTSAGNSGMSA
jgi:hypothetical protein